MSETLLKAMDSDAVAQRAMPRNLCDLKKIGIALFFALARCMTWESWKLKSLQLAKKELKDGDVQGLILESADIKPYVV